MYWMPSPSPLYVCTLIIGIWAFVFGLWEKNDIWRIPNVLLTASSVAAVWMMLQVSELPTAAWVAYLILTAIVIVRRLWVSDHSTLGMSAFVWLTAAIPAFFALLIVMSEWQSVALWFTSNGASAVVAVFVFIGCLVLLMINLGLPSRTTAVVKALALTIIWWMLIGIVLPFIQGIWPAILALGATTISIAVMGLRKPQPSSSDDQTVGFD